MVKQPAITGSADGRIRTYGPFGSSVFKFVRDVFPFPIKEFNFCSYLGKTLRCNCFPTSSFGSQNIPGSIYLTNPELSVFSDSHFHAFPSQSVFRKIFS